MSIISTGYDALITRLGTLFPAASGYQRLPNPYKPEENPEIYMLQGWGLALGQGENTNRVVNCKFSVSRVMTIVLMRKYEALENDDVSKAATEKLLFEDQRTLINDLEQDVTVGGSTMYTRWVSDGGLEYVRGDTDRFLMVRTDFALEYLEDFT